MPRLYTASSHNPLVMPCLDTASRDVLQHNLITGVHLDSRFRGNDMDGTGMADAGRECRISPIPSLLCLTQWAPTPAGSQRQLSKSGFEWQLSFQESNPKKSSRNRNRRINHHHFTIPLSCRALTRHPATCCSTTLLPEYIQSGLHLDSRFHGNRIAEVHKHKNPLRKFSPVIGGGKRFCRASGQAAGTYKIVRRRESTGR